MFSKIFIYRPVFALVISIVVALLGALAVPVLPVENTPDITPPTVQVSTTYPGASAAVIAETVAVPIEQEVNGVEDMIYLSSKSSDDGAMNLTVTFDIGTDIDMATILVQNRVSQAEPKLPEETKRQGITTQKQSTAMVLIANVQSPDGRYDEIYLSNYINLNIKDVLARVPGVSKVQVFGAKDYGMRIWMDPERLKARNLTTNEVVNAIREQNVQVAAGQIGAPPSATGQQFQYTVNTLGRLSEISEFEDMILKVSADGRLVRLRDVARVELGAQAYNWYMQLNGSPSIGLGIYQIPGSNALEVADGVRAAMDEAATRFPEGMEYRIAYDQTRFITASIAEVVETLLIAIALVIFTVYIFLQDFRTTIVPSVTIPVSLLGTFAVMLAMGMSINTLTLFGLVLAIGIVVDDAIVVVENTMRLIDEEGLPAKEATAKAMEQVTGPVIATTSVLLAVFVPTAMMGGITGRLYSQFAVTISVATVFSSINALTLSPALCGILLRPSPEKRNFVFRAFNNVLERTTNGYVGIVGVFLRRLLLPVAIMAGLLVALVWSFGAVPGGFLPDEDQGYFFANVTLPNGASLERTEAVLDRFNEIAMAHPDVADVLTIGGYSFLDSLVSSNNGAAFVVLKPWEERPDPSQHAIAVSQQLTAQLQSIQEAIAFCFIPPPIMGLGNAGGFEMQLQDRGGLGPQMLQTLGNDMVFNANADPALMRMNNGFKADVPQLFLDVDRTKAKTLGIPLSDIFGALQAYLGSAYVNDFNLFGRTYRVMIQADADYRRRIDDIARLEVRDRDGNMIPLSTLLSVRDTVGPQAVTRYNLYPSASITGSPVPGVSSGQAIATMERIAGETLPASTGFEWTGITYQQIATGNQAIGIFALATVLVYLFLAAQYESWFTPISVLSFIPVALLGAMLGTMARALDNNVYTQIGLVLLIGLAAKTAILIVEFAKQLREEGHSIVEAATQAARLRFRPVLMTAFSFILGVIPLLVASGAGAGSRRSLGTAVFSGFLIATVVGVFLVPAFYMLVQLFVEKVLRMAPRVETPSASGATAAVLLVALLGMTGCAAVGPDYVAPDTSLPDGAPMPDSWHSAAVQGLGTGDAVLETWWETFDDPALTALIDRARDANLDTQQALSRIEEARAQLGIALGEKSPTVDALGEYQIGENSEAETGIDGEVRGVTRVGAGASWEIDLFGRIRRTVEAATASYEASVEDYRDVLVSLYSEVALNYMDLRALQARITAARANVEGQRDSLRIAQARFDAGLVSQLDVEQAETNLGETEAQIPNLEASLNFALNRLAVLIATPPGTLHDELGVDAPIPFPASTVMLGIPADLVRQRPDIRRAERALASQTAAVGIATADLYPSFSLTGLLTFGIAGPGSGSGVTWNFIPGLRWRVFDGGRIRNNIKVQEARAEQLFLFYEQTVLRAMEDVENSLIAYSRESTRRDRLAEAVDAASTSVDLVNTQYITGLTDFQNVLDTQRSLFRLQDDLARSEGLVVQNLVRLYTAMGGGWRATDDVTAADVEHDTR